MNAVSNGLPALSSQQRNTFLYKRNFLLSGKVIIKEKTGLRFFVATLCSRSHAETSAKQLQRYTFKMCNLKIKLIPTLFKPQAKVPQDSA